MDKENKFRAAEWILAFVMMLGCFFYGDYVGKNSVEAQIPDVIRDTTVRIVTVYKNFPNPVKTVTAGLIAVPRYLFWTDTTEVQVPGPTEYVYLPSEQKYYEEEEGSLRIWISGYQPNLDRYEMDRPTTVITETYKPPNKRWGLGLYAGVGGIFAKEQSIVGSEAGLLLRYQSPKRWGFDLLGGYSATFTSGQFVHSPHVRMKVSYDLITW